MDGKGWCSTSVVASAGVMDMDVAVWSTEVVTGRVGMFSRVDVEAGVPMFAEWQSLEVVPVFA